MFQFSRFAAPSLFYSARADPCGPGPSQCLSGTLDRKLKSMENLGNMGGMVGDGKLLLNNAAHHRTCPDAGSESIGHGTTVKDVDQFLPLACGKTGRTTGSVAFQYAFHPILSPLSQPNGNVTPMYLTHIRNLRCRFSFHINPLLPSRVAWSILGGVAEAALYCAHRTSTFSSCAFCEQEGHLAAPLPIHPSKLARHSLQGQPGRSSIARVLSSPLRAG